jgi:small subunit ribosomal protein S9
MAHAATERFFATGKRKTAVARVTMINGNGDIRVNGKTVDEYFGGLGAKRVIRQPLDLIEVAEKYDIAINVCGGGPNGQADAIRHGIARALLRADPERRSALKKAGFLTRDARKKERKKYGQPGARKRFQYSKR